MDRLQREKADIAAELHQINLKRRELTVREDALLRRHQNISNQLKDEHDDAA